MNRFLFIVLWWFAPLWINAQCLTDFSKLVPEPSVDAAVGFGNSISMTDNYLAVGIPYHDTLGRATGIVHIYELIGGTWNRIAAMAPSDPLDGLRFGLTVKLTQNYLLVGAQVNGGKVYLFEKGPAGWTSGTEQTTFNYPATSYFGIHSNRGLAVSADQKTIAITDPYYHSGAMPLSRSGAIFIYHKGDDTADWDGSITPSIILSPEDDCQDFSSAGVTMYGNKLVTATPYAPTGIGRIYVYSDSSPGFQNSSLEARLDPGDPGVFYATLFGAVNLAYTQDGIFATAVIRVQDVPKFGIIYFETPASGVWSNTVGPTCYIEPKSDGSIGNSSPFSLSSNGSELFTAVRDVNGKGYLNIIRKGNDGWCSPSYELVDESEVPQSPLPNRYGYVFAFSQTASAAAVGFIPHPENQSAMLALRALHKDGSTWNSQTVYSTKKSTAGHFFGRDIVGFDDYMFVTASYDGTVKPNAGAVYCYKKVGTAWQKTGKILPPLGQNQYDDVFGSALATNKTYLAIGASGHEPKGKIFMYKKASNNWSSVELVQEVTIPEEGLTVYAYGDNVAMDDEWLLVPYVQNSPARIMLAIFKFNGTTWDFTQVVEVGFASFFAKESTLSVAIENGMIVAGGRILELNSNGIWEIKYTLSPSDPEPIQISSNFSYWISNGALFGHSVAIHDNTIFIGAPMRDYQGTWDVGAVYVYTKEPGESWSSRTETTKLVPRVKDENELFGYSLKALFNTLIVGAPGNDYNKNNTARNKPGRAYVFQAEDYFWENVNPLIDFTGESFEKDYYGISVYLDETDFFIGAAIEDIESGKLSGAVYVTPTPPIIKLAPPVCQSEGLIDLFGYPFGGTWSGPGIVDAAEGIFDPDVAGTGVHTFTYITESCAFPGKLRIRIHPPVQALLLVDEEQYVCSTTSSFSKVLSVQSQPGYRYQWFYRPSNSLSFTALNGEISASLTATQRGEYQVRVQNIFCHAFSPIIVVQNEVVDLQLDPVEPSCNNLSESIALNANPAGGSWSGMGVSNNVFNPKDIPAGSYSLIYKLTTENGCQFQKTLMVQVQQAFTPVITKLAGDLCDNGEVTLGLTGTVPTDMNVTWLELDLNQNEYLTVFENTNPVTIGYKGTFKARVSNQVCESMSESFVLNPELDLIMQPLSNAIEVCSDETLVLSFEDKPGSSYQWFKTTSESGTVQLDVNLPELSINETGYYKAVVTRGICVFESEPKMVVVHPRDTLFVPNVFTPNGDATNEVFEVISNQTVVSIDVYNRNGKLIYSGNGSSRWDGGDTTTGVYYWLIVYINCHDQRKTAKGWVHLIR